MSQSETAKARHGLVLGLIGVGVFGLTLPMSRLAVLELDPVFVALGRVVLAGICASVALWLMRAPWPKRPELPKLAVVAACIGLGFPLLMTIAMRYAPSAHGGVVLGVLPLLTAMASVVVAGERPSLGFWACGVVGSVVVAAYALLSAQGSAEVHWADVLLAVSAIAAGLGYAMSGELSRRMDGIAVISWALVIAAPFDLLLLLAWRPEVNWGASWAAWAGFAYVALMSQYIGFFAWNRGLALGGIAKVGQTQLLQTFVTLAGAAVILGERVGLIEVVFAVAVVGIVALGWRMRVKQAA